LITVSLFLTRTIWLRCTLRHTVATWGRQNCCWTGSV